MSSRFCFLLWQENNPHNSMWYLKNDLSLKSVDENYDDTIMIGDTFNEIRSKFAESVVKSGQSFFEQLFDFDNKEVPLWPEIAIRGYDCSLIEIDNDDGDIIGSCPFEMSISFEQMYPRIQPEIYTFRDWFHYSLWNDITDGPIDEDKIYVTFYMENESNHHSTIEKELIDLEIEAEFSCHISSYKIFFTFNSMDDYVKFKLGTSLTPKDQKFRGEVEYFKKVNQLLWE